jgi:hypothetical protein
MELNQTQWNQLTLNRLMAEINGGEIGLKMHDAAAIAEAQERARILAQTPAQFSAAPAPANKTPASNCKIWTTEKLAELKAYRELNTMAKTVKKFGISAQRIRQLLPSEKPTKNVYAGLIHQIK